MRTTPTRHRELELWLCDDVDSPLGRVNMSGRVSHTGIGPDAMRVLGCYGLIFLLEGGGHYRDALRNRALMRPGDVLVLFPDLAHAYGPPEGGVWLEAFVHFEGPIFDLLREKGVLDPRRPLHQVQPASFWSEELLKTVRTARLTRAADSAGKVCRLAHLLTQFFADAPPLPPEASWFEGACRLLEGDINEPLKMEVVAWRVGMSYHTFRERFAARAGVSPGKYRALKRLELAQKMLLQEELTGRAIAKSLGFADESAFSRAFRAHLGLSPREFRARHAQKPN